jgi:DNA-binding LacI/PurR family transcriptional regulator
VKKKKRATIREVAEATGLSAAGVSYALRGINTTVETQTRVRAAADELGYSANPAARALAGGPTGLIGVICGSLDDLVEQLFVEAVGRRLEDRGLEMLVTDAGGDPQREIDLARRLSDERVDGLIVSPLDPSARGWREIAAAVPLVSVGDALDAETAGEVIYDNRAGVELVLGHLASLGHKHIAVLTPNRPTTPARPAEVVVEELSERLGLEVVVVNSPHSIVGATRIAANVLGAPTRPSALFCLSDSIACGAYVAARAAGLAIPDDLAISGYDDHPVARALSPELTSVSWGMEGAAAAAADLLSAAIDDPRARGEVRVEPQLVVRGSTLQ